MHTPVTLTIYMTIILFHGSLGFSHVNITQMTFPFKRFDSIVSQAQNCLHINSKPFQQVVMKF